jgi:N-acetyl-anhydromuramyl-L-alanine amidase AmpD
MRKLTLFVLLFLLIFRGLAQKIIDRPIIYDSTRKSLSLQYLKERHGLEQSESTLAPKMIVAHWTAIPTFEGSFNAFNPVMLPSFRKELKGVSPLNVSIHFLVDRDGTIYRLMPENLIARHVIGLNWCALGIENVGDGNKFPLTEAQLKANIWLVKYLKKKYASIEYLIGHHEYTSFQDTPLWKESNPNYRTQKDDPGIDFMTKLRKGVERLNLKGGNGV